MEEKEIAIKFHEDQAESNVDFEQMMQRKNLSVSFITLEPVKHLRAQPLAPSEDPAQKAAEHDDFSHAKKPLFENKTRQVKSVLRRQERAATVHDREEVEHLYELGEAAHR